MSRSEELIAAYLDDAMTPAEEAELTDWLRADAANVRAFVEANAREQQLRAVVQARGELRRMETAPLRQTIQTKPVRRRPSVRFVLTAVAAAAVVMIGAVMLWQKPALPEARLGGEVAGVQVERAGSSLDAEAGMTLCAGDVVRSRRGGARIAIVGEDTHFTLAPRSAMVLQELRGQKRFELREGSVSAEVAKQPEGPMIWLTDDARAEVLGTKFGLSADALLTRLDVSEGAVQFQGRGMAETTIVRAGQLAATDSQGVIMPESPEPWQVTQRKTYGCEAISFFSEHADAEIGVNVLLPPSYHSEPSRRYPVLYFLHGLKGNEHTEAARFNRRFLTAMRQGEMPPFIAVFPNGGPGITPPAMVAARIFTQELTSLIDSRYRTQPDRSARMVCGIGFGGKRAVLYASFDSHVFGSGCAIDDTFHGGTPAFSRLLNALQARIERHPPSLLILHGQPWATEKVDTLAAAIRARSIAVETKALPLLPQSSPEYLDAATGALAIWMKQTWSEP
jgi:ferric-dicitrate binding protein FerR (iron transport regulator)